MERLHASTFIGAPRKKVWETMLGEETYQKWTKVFDPSSHYVGSWEKGSKIMFLAYDPNTKTEMGMVSRIEEARPYEFVSIKHEGIVKDGVEDRTSDAAKKWAPAFENYTFAEKDGGTELSIDMDISKEEKANMERLWQGALRELKALAEK